jgi:hypothetical protein
MNLRRLTGQAEGGTLPQRMAAVLCHGNFDRLRSDPGQERTFRNVHLEYGRRSRNRIEVASGANWLTLYPDPL